MKTAQQEQGARLKAAREAAKLTQAQVTERLGYGANTISQYERGDIGISDERIVQLAGLYGADPALLAGRPLTQKRNEAFYDGILHSLAVFNRASGELIAEVQRWREQSANPAGPPPAPWLSKEQIDADVAAAQQYENRVGVAEAVPPKRKKKTG